MNEKSIIKPACLLPGDNIGVIAPAGPVKEVDLKAGIGLLESAGYHVMTSPGLYKKNRYLAGDDDTRLADFNAMIEDRNIKAIICARGGYGTPRIIDKIDFELIRENPKIIIGYSDITALLLALYKRSGLICFHGPMVRDLNKDDGRNFHFLNRILSIPEPFNVDLSESRVLVQGRAEGTILGGNLSLLASLAGTPYMPSLEGSILLIEDRGEPVYRVDRMLNQLRLGNFLANISGVLLGEFKECGDSDEIERLVADFFRESDIPVVAGFPAGHGDKNITIPIGVSAEVDTSKRRLTFPEPYVC